MLAAQLNLAAGAEHCPAVDEAVQAAQVLLIQGDLDGGATGAGETAATASPDDASPEREGEVAAFLIEQLSLYNAGTLCR